MASELFHFLFQARNSYSNEVVAIKKMSYNGKQTTEVRKHTQTNREPCLYSKPRYHCECTTTCWWLHVWIISQNKLNVKRTLWSDNFYFLYFDTNLQQQEQKFKMQKQRCRLAAICQSILISCKITRFISYGGKLPQRNKNIERYL